MKKRNRNKCNDFRPPTMQDIYDRIPKIACQGKCAASCGPVPATEAEVDTIEQKTGTGSYGVRSNGDCNMLVAGRCRVYEQRPLMCRLWGVVKKMKCPFGCIPERWLSGDEARELLLAAGNLGGEYTVGNVVPVLGVDHMLGKGDR